MPKQFTDDVAAVVSRCGIEAIDGLLRQAQRAGKPVKVSAPTKEKLVEENLRRAVAEGHVSIDAVFATIEDWEEHRPQYHLLFRAAGEIAARLADDPGVARLLWGPNWERERGFPRVLDEPDGEQWADFRPLADGWIAKLYRGGSRWVLSETESTTTDDRRVRVWNRKYQREVWCARYYAARNILSMRIPNLDNKDDLREAQSGIWKAFENAVRPSEVEPFGVQKAAATMARDETGLGGRIHVSYSRFPGSRGGNATYSGQGDEEPLHNNPEFVVACQLFTIANEIVVYWRPTTATDAIRKKTRTVIGSRGPNSVLFSAESDRRCIEHVIAEIIHLQLAP